MLKNILVTATALLGIAWSNQPARAHPHLWIDASANFLFESGNIRGVRFQWTFDEFFSAGVIGEFDKNKNKQFDPDEIEPLRIGAFEGTKEVGFFTDIQIDGSKFDIQMTTDFAARIEKGIAVYEFTVPFAGPVDPVQKPVSVSVYDQSYFVDIAFQGQSPVKMTGDGSAKCTLRISEDRSNPIYGGVVYPKIAKIACPQ